MAIEWLLSCLYGTGVERTGLHVRRDNPTGRLSSRRRLWGSQDIGSGSHQSLAAAPSLLRSQSTKSPGVPIRKGGSDIRSVFSRKCCRSKVTR